MAHSQDLNSYNRKVLLFMASFIGTHTVMSHDSIREKLIKMCNGERKFALIYSLVTFATLGPATYVYFKHTKGNGDKVEFIDKNKKLYENIGLIFAMKSVFMMPLLSTGKLIAPGLNKEQRQKFVSFGGILRITRHPTFWMIALLSASQILRQQRYSDIYYFLPMIIEALLGSIHQDQRLRKWYPSQYFDKSSWFPYIAILTGKQSLNKTINEIGYKLITLSIILSMITYWISKNHYGVELTVWHSKKKNEEN